MTPRVRAGFACFALVSVGTIAVGLVYVSLPRFMPYHAAAIGRSWDELDSALQVLVLALLKGGGGAALATGLAMGLLLWIPFRRGEAWSRWAIALIGAVGYLPLLYATLSVQMNTPASAPWVAVAAALALLAAGFVLTSGLGIAAIASNGRGRGEAADPSSDEQRPAD